jgi:hypothetical protein
MRSIELEDFIPAGRTSRLVAALLLGAWLGAASSFAQTGNGQLPSKWDQDILNAELHDVAIDANSMEDAWDQISSEYLLRANFYLDAASDADSAKFAFKRAKTTGKELLQAFLSVYPAYTYTNDPVTGVLWLHRKAVAYNDILSQKILIERPAREVPVLGAVLTQLSAILPTNVILSPDAFKLGSKFAYSVDLQPGAYSVGQILNLCCVANPCKSFKIAPVDKSRLQIIPKRLDEWNPLAHPRDLAVRFWEVEIGRAANGTPSAREVAAAMSDANPRKRWAARAYLEAAEMNYTWADLIRKDATPEETVWAALGVEEARFHGINDTAFFRMLETQGLPITNALAHVTDASVALLALLESAKEQRDADRLEAIARQHHFTGAEIASILPDIYRMAHQSKLVLDKLKTMKLDAPELSPESLHELENTNLFILPPPNSKID